MEIETQIAVDRERAAAEKQREKEKSEFSRRKNTTEVEVGGGSVVRRPVGSARKIGGLTAASASPRNGANRANGGGSVVKKPQIKRKPGRAF
jgi:pre-mRNA-splicing factor ATP-dependent RNA helicase DHX38/PRP16